MHHKLHSDDEHQSEHCHKHVNHMQIDIQHDNYKEHHCFFFVFEFICTLFEIQNPIEQQQFYREMYYYRVCQVQQPYLHDLLHHLVVPISNRDHEPKFSLTTINY